MKKLPYGISDYEKIIKDNYYYVDKTVNIEKLENLSEPYIMFLRPRKFGKTLFTSTLEHYYDINQKDEFETLFSQTYIGKNPTKLKNSYHVLRFNFSGIDTSSGNATISGFKARTMSAIKVFCEKYKLDFYINENDEAENILDNLFKAFYIQKASERLYVIIDEYDHFSNELLGFDTEKFKDLVSKNGKIRKWYEVLKQGTESVVDRIFIKGVAPITLDSLTSGFNISTDITQDEQFNEMLGFTKKELIVLMKEQDISKEKQELLLPLLKENYDGYIFSMYGNESVYNSNMCLFLLSQYIRLKRIPEDLVDSNIASGYSKLDGMLDICEGDNKMQILERTISGEGILTEITRKFNPEIGFGEKEFASMLFYLGYLTIRGNLIGKAKLQIPNLIMRELYSSYFMELVNNKANLKIDQNDYNEIIEQIAYRGEITKLTELLHIYLNNLSNRDFQRFDEKYVKLICYCLAMNLKIFSVKSELEVNRNYPDLLITPHDKTKGYKSVMIEFKYLKKNEFQRLTEKQKEAKEQIERYGEFEDIKNIKGLSKYTIVVVNDTVYVEKV